MSATREEINSYLNELLKPEWFRDYCPNGLQVEGKRTIHRIVSGVTANQAFIDKAIDVEADALLVHHGFFWKGEPQVITGMKRRRLQALIGNNVNLFAYHLPLDAHPVHGNNAELAKRLALIEEQPLELAAKRSVGSVGRLEAPMSAEAFGDKLERVLGFDPLHIGEPERVISTIAWCTGAAQSYLAQAVDFGVDAFLTGEISENTVHTARECGIQFFAAGHHATERYGVQAVGELLSLEFDIEHQFIDVPVPV